MTPANREHGDDTVGPRVHRRAKLGQIVLPRPVRVIRVGKRLQNDLFGLPADQSRRELGGLRHRHRGQIFVIGIGASLLLELGVLLLRLELGASRLLRQLDSPRRLLVVVVVVVGGSTRSCGVKSLGPLHVEQLEKLVGLRSRGEPTNAP